MNKKLPQKIPIFKDHFSDQSSGYQTYRPSYPEALFKYLSLQSPTTQKVWDCATGSGQAAVSLSHYFDQVIATDASQNQIENAIPGKSILYKVATAEQSGLESESIDLICVAQALHWFNFEKFFLEADRVLKTDGLIAVWSYELLSITPEIDQLIHHFYDQVLNGYWSPERVHIENNYQQVNFPYQQLETPKFTMETKWDCSQLMGYFSTWSAVKKYIKENQHDPVEDLSNKIQKYWQDSNQQHMISWPLNLILCKKTTD